MSGIFGIFNRNGKPIEKKIVDIMLDAMSDWEPDDRGFWIGDSVAFGHTMLWNTPESKLEDLPNKQDKLVITMDARLDNREELADSLQMLDRPLNQITDSQFILEAYRKWGEDCPKYLLGDFVFAIWDKETQHLFCARDHIGIKPLFYYLDEDVFIFSNHVKGMLVHPKITQKLDEKAIAIYMKEGQLNDRTRTFYNNIKKILPASIVKITKDKVNFSTYWLIEDCPKIRFASYEEYVNTLRDLLTEAVKKRIRSDYPVASHLSGGLDSSAIAIIASRLLKSNNKILHAYNWTPVLDNENPNYREWAYSERIALQENMIHSALRIEIDDILNIYSSMDIRNNDTITFWYEHLVQDSLRKNNERTILSGWGGDDLITYDGFCYKSELFWGGNFKRVFSLIYSEVSGKRYPMLQFIRQFYHTVIVPKFPTRFFCKIGLNIGVFNCASNAYKKLLTRLFSLKIKQYGIKDKYIGTSTVREEQLSSFYHGYMQTRIESWNASGFNKRVEYRYPLLDKKIVEFAMGIPNELYQKKGIGRYIFRSATYNILPDYIRWAGTKSEPKRVENHDELLIRVLSQWVNMEHLNIEDDNSYIDYKLIIKNLNDISKKKKMSSHDFYMLYSIENSILMKNIL